MPPAFLMTGVRITAFIAGFYITGATVLSAVRFVVVPRAESVWSVRLLFRNLRKLFELRLKNVTSYEERDRVMSYYAPTGLMLLPVLWLVLVTVGYTLMFWGVGFGDGTLYDALWESGSSLLTLGYRSVDTLVQMILSFSEATIGLILIALLIAYLPTMYASFSRREAVVSKLEIRAGSPPSAEEMLIRYHRLGRLPLLSEVWIEWEEWFVFLEESHTSLAPLIFFRSPQHDRSWITAAGAVLDCAALTLAAVDTPEDTQAAICIRSGYLALRRIADFLQISYDPNPDPEDPISISRVEFDEVFNALKAAGVPLKDHDTAWKAFAGWRVNYDSVLIELAGLTMAPYARWSSDRSLLRSRRR